MSWTATVEGRLFVMDDAAMVRHLIDRYNKCDGAVGDEFAEWVDNTYTPYEAMESDLDDSLRIWAEETVRYRPDIIMSMVPWVHWKEEKE